MDKKKIEWIVGTVVVLSLVWIYGVPVFKKTASSEVEVDSDYDGEDALENVRLFDGEISPKRAKQKEYAANLVWKRDPFFANPIAQTQDLPQLQGILWDEKAPMAILGGEPVREGQTVGNVQVVTILQDHIVILQGENLHRLSMDETTD